MRIFAIDPHDQPFGEALAAGLDVPLAAHELRRFEDGECKMRPLVDPRGEDVYVVQSLHGGPEESPHDKLFRLLMFIAAVRDHGARRVTAVVPYLAYARKDRQTKPFDPVGQRYVAQLLESVGTSQVIVLEVHNPAAFQNAFRCPAVHLEARHAFTASVAAMLAGAKPVVASPDPGGTKRAQLLREALEAQTGQPVGFAMIDKRRSAGVVSGAERVSGDVEGADVLLFDDIIATGGTLARAAQALREAGARRVFACAAHGLFVGVAGSVLADAGFDDVLVTDSVPAFRLNEEQRRRIRLVSCVPLFAQAIHDSHASWRRG